MKKVILLIGLLALFALSIPTILLAHPYFDGSQSDYGFSSRPCHQNNQERSYEWYYAHLSSEDQTYVDTLFVQALVEIDFYELTEEEQLVALTEIKDALRDVIIEEGLVIYARR
ncbi:MAG: hypothetical protein ACNA7U_03285 [Candidatus Izemoplasmataceae bacterium]|jgi:hypothetical protein|uniref:hypothetical protein n=1 Tax=Liberiplasma polymorphum TaxID=3374570 RepID=UPI0037766250